MQKEKSILKIKLMDLGKIPRITIKTVVISKYLNTFDISYKSDNII